MAGILDGVVVADFSRVLAGPLATTMLADLGATVVKVERPGVGDDTRHWGPPWTATTSSYFESANRSKQSIALDLSDPDDHAVALDLASRADVLVENFKHGTLAGKGLGYEQLSEVNPRLVYCSVTGFGSAGGADLPGYDFLVQAVGGLMSITGDAAGEPTKVGVALVDVLTSKDAYAAIMAALFERERSGRGQHVEVNLLSSLLGSLANQASAYLATGTAPRRQGNAHPSIAPYQTLRCADGEFAVCCGNDRQFAALAEAIGDPGLARDPRFATNGDRVAHRLELVAVLEQHLASRTAREWSERLLAAGVPAGEVGDIGSAFALAESLGLGPRVPVGPDAADQVRHPATYSRTPVTHYTRPPRLGEHDAAVRSLLNEENEAV
ncbi:putative L-carnitine dehydratase [Aeromicrobium flavum]|uniref:Putative L-carnitine dehydratase n=1 Tax=Aeromicrobium flavum TaxID=416568 RepID=A0A512HRD6_9ACTN|nr:CoA transferase [Aeromicrobium flavum]GEO88014.1 putative L-carnitine dehydratase [Aeromicrobium flavum]